MVPSPAMGEYENRQPTGRVPFVFRQVYRLTNPSKNYLGASQIVMGVRAMPGGYEFAAASPNWRHEILGRVVEEKDDTLAVLDAVRVGNDGAPVVWLFEPLTLERWRQMKAEIVGFDSLKADLVSTGDIQNFYMADCFPDGWTEVSAG